MSGPPARADVALFAVAILFWLDIVEAKHLLYYSCKLFLRSSVNDMFFRSCDVVGVENLSERLGTGAELNVPAQETSGGFRCQVEGALQGSTTGVEKIISSLQSWLQADKKDIQILSLRPKGLYGTMCHLDFQGHFVLPGFAGMSGLISSWRAWACAAWTF